MKALAFRWQEPRVGFAVNSKYAEYVRNANVCVRLSKTTSNEEFRESWLRLAQSWMEMVPPEADCDVQTFEASAKAQGTHQTDSTVSH